MKFSVSSVSEVRFEQLTKEWGKKSMKSIDILSYYFRTILSNKKLFDLVKTYIFFCKMEPLFCPMLYLDHFLKIQIAIEK